MIRKTWWARLLRIAAVVLMSLASAFTLLGGVGTACVALNPTGFGGSFTGIAPFQWLWLVFVLVGIAVGIMGVRAVILLVRGKKNAFSYSLVALILGIVLNAVHVYASRTLRGSSMPVDSVLYTNLVTLLFFLLIRLPGIWKGVDFHNSSNEDKISGQASAIALGASGLLTLTIQWLVASSHTVNGINYADVWQNSLTLIGLALIIGGIATAICTGLIWTGHRSMADPSK
jgi:hypothetical protein